MFTFHTQHSVLGAKKNKALYAAGTNKKIMKRNIRQNLLLLVYFSRNSAQDTLLFFVLSSKR